MKSPSGTKAGRRNTLRRLAGVNRRITELCNELESLQQVQGVLERDIERDPGYRPGRPSRRRKGSS